jgi:hypothetical protein
MAGKCVSPCGGTGEWLGRRSVEAIIMAIGLELDWVDADMCQRASMDLPSRQLPSSDSPRRFGSGPYSPSPCESPH